MTGVSMGYNGYSYIDCGEYWEFPGIDWGYANRSRLEVHHRIERKDGPDWIVLKSKGTNYGTSRTYAYSAAEFMILEPDGDDPHNPGQQRAKLIAEFPLKRQMDFSTA